jgi:hypothetical protein
VRHSYQSSIFIANGDDSSAVFAAPVEVNQLAKFPNGFKQAEGQLRKAEHNAPKLPKVKLPKHLARREEFEGEEDELEVNELAKSKGVKKAEGEVKKAEHDLKKAKNKSYGKKKHNKHVFRREEAAEEEDEELEANELAKARGNKSGVRKAEGELKKAEHDLNKAKHKSYGKKKHNKLLSRREEVEDEEELEVNEFAKSKGVKKAEGEVKKAEHDLKKAKNKSYGKKKHHKSY